MGEELLRQGHQGLARGEAREVGLHHLDPRLEPDQVEDGADQGFLGGEVAEHQRLADAGAPREITGARSVETLLREDLQRGREDLRAAVAGREP